MMLHSFSSKKFIVPAVLIVFLTAIFTYLLVLKGSEDNVGSEAVLGQTSTTSNPMAETVACLKEKGVVIYGSKTCPACMQMVRLFGDYETIDPIYVECQREGARCSREMKTQYVPEVQINSEVFDGPATPDAIAAAVGCTI